MASDPEPTADTALIQDFIKELAPGIAELSCGTTLAGGYELWLRLDADSQRRVPITISKEEYKSGQWKDKIKDAIEEANT